MAWIKIPAENHPIFHAALPLDPRVSTMNMFGGVAAIVNGHMMAGLFGRSALVKLSPEDQKAALALDGAEPFDPMGNGRVMKDTIFLPETIMDEPAELADWLRRGLEYTASLPPKVKKGAAKEKAAKPAAKPKVMAARPVKAKATKKTTKAAAARPKASTPARGAAARRKARPSKRR